MSSEPPSAAVHAALTELNAIVEPDGAQLRLLPSPSPGSVVALELDVSQSSCPECVLPKDLLLAIITERVTAADPDVREVLLDDPRSGHLTH